MNIKDFKVGDEVILVTNEKDYVNGDRKDKIRREKVMSIGRKYVHVTRRQNEEFIDKFSDENYFPYGLVEVVNVGRPVYLFKSMEDYNNYLEWKKLLRYITLYKFNNLSLEQLRAIKEIIDNSEEG